MIISVAVYQSTTSTLTSTTLKGNTLVTCISNVSIGDATVQVFVASLPSYSITTKSMLKTIVFSSTILSTLAYVSSTWFIRS